MSDTDLVAVLVVVQHLFHLDARVPLEEMTSDIDALYDQLVAEHQSQVNIIELDSHSTL